MKRSEKIEKLSEELTALLQKEVDSEVPDVELDARYGTYGGEKTKKNILTSGELLARQYPEEEWHIKKFLSRDGITMFVGTAGVGKSYFAAYLARCLVRGDNFLGQEEFEVKTRTPVLLIDKENGLRRMQKRLQGMSFTNEDEFYLMEYPEVFDLDDNEIIAYITEFIETKGIGVVILDSFIDVIKGNENSSTDTAAVFNKLRGISHDVAWVILHHESKQVGIIERSAGDKTRGSSNIQGQVSAQFHLKKAPDNDNDLIIEQGKARDHEPLGKIRIGFDIDLDQNIVTGFIYKGIETEEKIQKIEECKKIILEIIEAKNGGLIQKDIIALAMEYGLKESNLKRAFKVLVDDGKIEQFFKEDDKKRKYCKVCD